MPLWRRRCAELRSALAGVERWLLPPCCLLCGDSIPPAASDGGCREEPLVCALCRLRWRRLPSPLCSRCGQPEPGEVACLVCRDWPPGLARVRSAVWLDGPARQAVHRLKYGGWWRLAEAMAEPMARMVLLAERGEALTGQVFLVPVPLGATRLRRRGYNQSERLAVAVGRRLGIPVRADLLIRIRETGTQTALAPGARLANVRGAFRVSERWGHSRRGVGSMAGAPLADGGRVMLVDDVFTTGATLLAAAEVMRAAGAATIEAITFARATPPMMNL